MDARIVALAAERNVSVSQFIRLTIEEVIASNERQRRLRRALQAAEQIGVIEPRPRTGVDSDGRPCIWLTRRYSRVCAFRRIGSTLLGLGQLFYSPVSGLELRYSASNESDYRKLTTDSRRIRPAADRRRGVRHRRSHPTAARQSRAEGSACSRPHHRRPGRAGRPHDAALRRRLRPDLLGDRSINVVDHSTGVDRLVTPAIAQETEKASAVLMVTRCPP